MSDAMHSEGHHIQTSSSRDLFFALAPQLLAVCITFLLTGAAFAALPLFVSRALGFGPAVIGLLTGLSFLFAILVRLRAGGYADQHGPKPVIVVGLGMVILSGLFSAAAVEFKAQETTAVALLIVGRLCLGGAEGMVMVAAQTWALAIAGPRRSGLVIGWVGTAMFAAMAIGAPLGGMLYAGFGFIAVAAAMIAIPLPVLLVIRHLRSAQVAAGDGIVILDVARRIALHCFAMSLVAISYGAIMSFSVLLFEERGWVPVWGGLTGFSLALVFARVFGGTLPDRFGGVRTALWSLLVMILGLGLLAFSREVVWGLAGTCLTGLGYALVYPSIGREALDRIPARSKGSAMAVYASAASLMIGLGGPVLGLLAEANGNGFVFAAAGGLAIVAMALTLRLRT